MKPNTTARSLQTSGLDESAEFGISEKDSAHIMTILRDTLYSDKILAVLREYSANAWDAHRMVDKSDVPIKVTLPTVSEPTLSIRDFGPGLSQEEVFTVYTQYGASTKRNSDKTVGMLGIGSKSGFAYSDSFTINSFYGGMQSTYVAVLDKSEKGVINLLNRQPCGDETGIEIQIPVKPTDIPSFTSTARDLYRFFEPLPDINTKLVDFARKGKGLEKGIIFEEGNDQGWTAVMGCVPYRINLDQIRDFKPDKEESAGISSFLHSLSGVLFFNIGEVQINASREELKYADETKTALITRFNELVEEYVRGAILDVQQSGLNLFQRRLRLITMRMMKFALPVELKKLISDEIEVKGIENFSFYRYDRPNKDPLSNITVKPHLRFVLKDDSRAFSGYTLLYTDYIVKKSPKVDWDNWDTAEDELKTVLTSLDLAGVPVVRISSLPYNQVLRDRNTYAANSKHAASVFRLHLDRGNKKGSDAWVIEEHVPAADDVFVILKKFKTEDYDFYYEHRELKYLADAIGITLPHFYGYKSTTKHPLKKEDVLGVEFLDWRNTWLDDLPRIATTNPDVIAKLEDFIWVDLGQTINGGTYLPAYELEKKFEVIEGRLGKDHSVCKILRRFSQAVLANKDWVQTNALKNFRDRTKVLKRWVSMKSSGLKKEILVVRKKYPLFGVDSVGMGKLFSDERWIDYVMLVDKENNRNGTTQIQSDQRIADNRVGRKDQNHPQIAAQLPEPQASAAG